MVFLGVFYNQVAYQEAVIKQQREEMKIRENALNKGLAGAQSRGKARILSQQEIAAQQEIQRQNMNYELKRHQDTSIAGSRARELNNR